MRKVILINVGTPSSFEPDDVGVYLKEFLMDENIISIPRPFRDFLVKGLIVPKRKYSSAEKYKKIWTDQGSPLLVGSESLKKKLQEYLGASWQVEIGMQVGKPSLKEVLENSLKSSDEIYFCPLYPQYATATTGGALQLLKFLSHGIRVQILSPFYQEPWFIQSASEKIKMQLKPHDFLLLSYHGLPVSQLKKHRVSCYQTEVCCEKSAACIENCYRAQCLMTSKLIQKELQHDQVVTSFQSRLGKGKWIEPSSQEIVNDLLQQGVRHLKVACPSFVVDCLETLEEIGMELKTQFLQRGGESFELIPCVNDSDAFIQGLGNQLKNLKLTI